MKSTIKSSYRANQWVDEACSNAGAHFSDGQYKVFRHSLTLWHVGQGQVGLGHADRQVVETLGTNNSKSRFYELLSTNTSAGKQAIS
jgi:hypothetical protein